MKKKMFKSAYAVTYIATLCFISFSTLFQDRSSFSNNDLLFENVEALAQDTGDDGLQKTCGTKTKYWDSNGLIECPECKAMTGKTGVQYSCQKNGDAESCKEGFQGTEVTCTPYHNTSRDINEVKTHSCKGS